MTKERKERQYHPLVFSKTSYYPILSACTALNREALYFCADSTSTIKLAGLTKWDKHLGTGKRFKQWLEELRKIITEYYWANEITTNEFQDALIALEYERVMKWFLSRRLNEVHSQEDKK